MVRKYWECLSLQMKILFALCGWIFLFILIHGTFTYRANHQKAFASTVGKRIGIQTIRVSAKSSVLILEGSATREQSDYAERISQDYIMRYGPRSVNPPTEIRNSLRIRDSFQRPLKQTRQVVPTNIQRRAAHSPAKQRARVLSRHEHYRRYIEKSRYEAELQRKQKSRLVARNR